MFCIEILSQLPCLPVFIKGKILSWFLRINQSSSMQCFSDSMRMRDLQSHPCISLYCVIRSANNDGTHSFPYCSCNVLSWNLHFLFPFCCIEKYVTKQLAEISYIRISYFTHIFGISMMNVAILKLTSYSWLILENIIFSQKVKFPTFCGTLSHIQYSNYQSVSGVRQIQSTPFCYILWNPF